MQRNLLIDGLKVFASQTIVFHHLAAYGPLSDVWDAAATQSSDWAFEYGRMAVQIFLVIGGFLAARGLSASSLTMQGGAPLRQVLQRYLRLVLPLAAALAIAIPSALLARHWASYQFFPEFPTWRQIWSHVFLLQDILGERSLSAGVWYVAIDFQLFALFTVFAALGRPWAQAGVTALMLASLFHFNLNPHLDSWALYFFGAYGMGAVAYWAAHSTRPVGWLAVVGLVGTIALAVDYRERIVLATLTAVLLGYGEYRATSTPLRERAPQTWMRLLTVFGNASYALFLVHFSVVMLANALYARLGLHSPLSAACAILGCWLVSNALGLVFEKWVDRPLQQLQKTLMAGLQKAQPSNS